MPFLIPHSPLINCSLLSFKLSTSKLFSERERAFLTVFNALQLSAPWDAALIFAWARVVLCRFSVGPHTVTWVFPKGGTGSENAALTELKSGKLCNFGRFLQNLDENQKESLLYGQNEHAHFLWYVLMCCLIIKHWKSEFLYVTEKFIGFKKRKPLRPHPLLWCTSLLSCGNMFSQCQWWIHAGRVNQHKPGEDVAH